MKKTLMIISLIAILCMGALSTTGGRLDTTTQSIMIVDYEHHEIHSGSHFYIAGYGTYAADEDIDFQLTTSNTAKWIHMTFSFQSTGATVFTVYEGATVGAGTPVTAFNSNRNYTSTVTSLTLLQYDGTPSGAGTPIYQQAWGFTDTPTKSEGGVSSRSNEIVLKQNTTYRFFIESNSAGNIISYTSEWYEHTNKN